MGRGLLAPKAGSPHFAGGGGGAATRSYQTALQSAQQHLGLRGTGSASAAAAAGPPDLPTTRGRERNTGRALREALEQQGTAAADPQTLVQVAMLEALENMAQSRSYKDPDTLEDLLFGTLGKEEEDASKLGSTSRGSTNLTRWHSAVERNPEMFIEAFNLQVVKALGADISGTPWSLQLYATS
eukprot:2767825-Amphidinium_carterae.1